MKKKNYWPIFFIGIFSFVFGMIIWTIMSATSLPVHEDESFLKKYVEVDENFNNIVDSNKNFLKKYDIFLSINSKKLALSFEDIRYSQRVLEKVSKHKNLLNVGKNTIKVYVVDKKTQEKENIKINLNITKSLLNNSDIKLSNSNFKEENKIYKNSFDIKEVNNWNITGSFKINNSEAFIYIKTNAV